MDVLVKYLDKYRFNRLDNKLGSPVVIHCVPGAGKSSLIREIIREDGRFLAFTAGRPDPPHLSGRVIKKWTGEIPPDKFVLLDEYTLLETVPGVFAVFGDPLQGLGKACLPANFTSIYSHRFGSATSQFLKGLDFEVLAEGNDCVQILDIFTAEPEEVLLYFEAEIGELLCRHNLSAKHIDEVQGATFDSVTFVTTENTPSADRVRAFECLTRHRRCLRILCPNATYTTA